MWELRKTLECGDSPARPKDGFKKKTSRLRMRPKSMFCRFGVHVSPFWYQGTNPKLLYQALMNSAERQTSRKGFPHRGPKGVVGSGPASASWGCRPLTPSIVVRRRPAWPARAGEYLPTTAGRDASRPAFSPTALPAGPPPRRVRFAEAGRSRAATASASRRRACRAVGGTRPAFRGCNLVRGAKDA